MLHFDFSCKRFSFENQNRFFFLSGKTVGNECNAKMVINNFEHVRSPCTGRFQNVPNHSIWVFAIKFFFKKIYRFRISWGNITSSLVRHTCDLFTSERWQFVFAAITPLARARLMSHETRHCQQFWLAQKFHRSDALGSLKWYSRCEPGKRFCCNINIEFRYSPVTQARIHGWAGYTCNVQHHFF